MKKYFNLLILALLHITVILSLSCKRDVSKEKTESEAPAKKIKVETESETPARKIKVEVEPEKPPIKTNEVEAKRIARDAFNKAVPNDVAQRYKIWGDPTRISDGWLFEFIDPNSGILGDHFLVHVKDDKTTEILPGE